MTYSKLFSPYKIGSMTVPNRIVMTAMGNYLSEKDGMVSEADIAFYEERAKGGVGLIITECTSVDSKTGIGDGRQITVDDDRCIPGLKRMADAVHAHGAKICVQIYHPGRQGIVGLNPVESMKSASQTECQCVHQPTHAMSVEEIHEMVDNFAQAARRVKEAGIDAVEIHGAHGYLINQFTSPYTNLRTDEYGGSFENRLRFLDEIIDAVREQVGPDYPVLVRYSVDEHMDYAGLPDKGLHLEDGIAIARHLANKPVDALDVSSGIYESMNTAWEPVSFDQGWKIEGPAAVKNAVDLPVIGVSVIRDPAYAEQILEEGKVDFVGSARQFFADPYWPAKAREGREDEIRKCISCLYCMESLMGADQSPDPCMACAINFEGGKETKYLAEKLPKDGAGKCVAIIGGGPAGMEAARIAGIRGFKTVLFEAKEYLGGQVYLASKPPKKEKTAWLIDYQKKQLEKYDTEIRLGCPVTIEALKELDPYAVIIAQGSNPIMPGSIPGIRGDHVYTPVEILDGTVKFSGKNVAVVGSGMTGIETAELLGDQGNQVTVFEMADEIGPGIFFQNLIDVMKRVSAHGTKLYPKHRLDAIEGTRTILTCTDTGVQETYEFDAVVVSLGVFPNPGIAEEIKNTFDNVVFAGDAKKAGRIEAAIRTGYLAAAELS